MSTPKSSLGDAAFRRKDLMGSSIEASYAGALSFLRRKYTRNLKGVDVAVTGIPFRPGRDQPARHEIRPAGHPPGVCPALMGPNVAVAV